MKSHSATEKALDKTTLPKGFTWAIVSICVLPLLLNFFGVDFKTQKNHFDNSLLLGMSPGEVADFMHYSLSGSFVHTLLEWSAFCTAIFTVMLTFVHFKMKRDVATPIVGMALFCAGCMDAFHTLAADRLFGAVADSRNLIPFTWAICRLFNALIMIIGVMLFLGKGKGKGKGKGFYYVVANSMFFAVVAYFIIYICATTEHLPQTMFPNSIVTRPWDVAPLILFVFAGAVVFPRFYRQTPSVFSYALIISTIPQISTQCYMAFGSKVLFDNSFNIAHFIKILAYLVPLLGLLLDSIHVYKREKLTVLELQVTQSQLTETEARVSSILNNALDPIITIDQGCHIESFNSAAEKAFGYDVSEVIGKNVKILMPEPFKSNHDTYVANYLRTGKACIIGMSREVIGARKDGGTFPIDLSISEMRIVGRRLFIGIVRDITESSK